MKILHIAPQNFAGMPFDFVKMHRQAGFESRLVTLFRNTINFEEDICLNFNLPVGNAAKRWRDSKIEAGTVPHLRFISPKNFAEKVYFVMRDQINSKKINQAIKTYNLFDYDIYHFDGGMDFYRNLHFVRELKKKNKKIVCCYYGSDLRTRGIFKELDDMSDLNLTLEYDHLTLHKNLNYIFFPFDVNEFSIKPHKNKKLKIIHSPTNRRFKGTDKILRVMNEVEKEKDIEFILLENMDRNKVLEIKGTCDLAIDQVGGEMGGSGYGKNSIENLSMGVPTFTEFTEDYLKFLKDNPFIHSTIHTLKGNMIQMIDSESLRAQKSIQGKQWVEKYHSYNAVNEMLLSLYAKNNII